MQQDAMLDRDVRIVHQVIGELKSAEKQTEKLDWTNNSEAARFLFKVFKRWVEDRLLGEHAGKHHLVKPEPSGKDTRKNPLMNPEPAGPFKKIYDLVIQGMEAFKEDKDSFWYNLEENFGDKFEENIRHAFSELKDKTFGEILDAKKVWDWIDKTNFVVELLHHALKIDFEHRFNMLKGKEANQRVDMLRRRFVAAYNQKRHMTRISRQKNKIADRPANPVVPSPIPGTAQTREERQAIQMAAQSSAEQPTMPVPTQEGAEQPAKPATAQEGADPSSNPETAQERADQPANPAAAPERKERRADMDLRLTCLRDELAILHNDFVALVNERFSSEDGESPISGEAEMGFTIYLHDGTYDEWFLAGRKERFLLSGDDRVVACAVVESPVEGKAYFLRFDSVRWLSGEEDGDMIEVWETETMNDAMKMVLDEINRDEDLSDGLFALDKPEIGDDFDSVEQKLIRLMAAETR